MEQKSDAATPATKVSGSCQTNSSFVARRRKRRAAKEGAAAAAAVAMMEEGAQGRPYQNHSRASNGAGGEEEEGGVSPEDGPALVRTFQNFCASTSLHGWHHLNRVSTIKRAPVVFVEECMVGFHAAVPWYGLLQNSRSHAGALASRGGGLKGDLPHSSI